MLGLDLGISMLNSPATSARYNKHLTTVILYRRTVFCLDLKDIFLHMGKNSLPPVINKCHNFVYFCFAFN